MTDPLPEQEYYCYADIRSLAGFIISLFNMLAAMLLCTYTLSTYLRLPLSALRGYVKIIYLSIIIWAISTLLVNLVYTSEFIFGDILFMTHMIDNVVGRVLPSKLYSAMDALPAFIVQGLFLLVPYNMYKDNSSE